MKLLTKDKGFYKPFFTMLGYIALQNLILCSVNLADNIMLGAYSEDAMSGVSMVNQLQFMLQMIVNGVGDGMAVLTAQYWGNRNTAPIKRIIAGGMLVALGLGLLYMAATMLWPRELLSLLTNEAAVLDEGVKYISVMSYAYVFLCLTLVLLSGMRSVENVKIGTIISLSTLVVNISLNYLLIFGKCGLPELGTQGAAIATLIARVLEFGILLTYTLCIEKNLKLKLKDLVRTEAKLFRDFVRVSLPVVLSGASWGVAMCIQAAILGRMGSTAIAANAIAGTVFGVISVISYGGASASGVITGMVVGRGDTLKLKEYVNTMQILFLAIGLVAGTLLFFSRDLILLLYPSILPDTQVMSRSFLTVLSLTIVGTSYQVSCLTGIVRAGGDTKFVLYNDLIFMWCIVLPFSALGAFVWQLEPVYVFLILKSDQVLKCVVAFFEVNSYRWVHNLTKQKA